MKNKEINRREFLKGIGGVIAGIFCMKLGGILGSSGKDEFKGSKLKEAKYYTPGKDLAG